MCVCVCVLPAKGICCCLHVNAASCDEKCCFVQFLREGQLLSKLHGLLTEDLSKHSGANKMCVCVCLHTVIRMYINITLMYA